MRSEPFPHMEPQKSEKDPTPDFDKEVEQQPGVDPEQMEPTFVNKKVETAYRDLQRTLTRIETNEGSHKVKELLLSLINSGLEETEIKPLNMELLREIDLKIVRSESASEIAGQAIERPVFVFKSTETFKRFNAALTGSTDAQDITSRGFVTDLDMAIRNGVRIRIQLIVAAPDNKHIDHEIRHTIDPYLGQREGYNRILEETFAYYWQCILKGRWQQEPSRLWDDLRASIWGDSSYYTEYSEAADHKITFNEYGRLTGRIVDTVKQLHIKYGDHTKVQRAIALSKTLDDLFALVT